MKAYTDLEQSKKLAKILPIESADMHYVTWTILENGEFEVSMNQTDTIKSLQEEYGKQIIPCWSIAALLDALPRIEHLKPSIDLNLKLDSNEVAIYYYSEDSPYIVRDNLIDAIFEMILKLHELKLL